MDGDTETVGDIVVVVVAEGDADAVEVTVSVGEKVPVAEYV